MNNLVEQFYKAYLTRNKSYKKEALFYIGTGAGFFSELNHMLSDLIYYDYKKIRFRIFSDKRYFASKKGWEEYFEPFSKRKRTDRLLKEYNKRFAPKDLSTKKKIKLAIFKKLSGVDYLTYDMMSTYLISSKRFAFGDFYQISKNYANMVWRFNKKTEQKIGNLTKSINLPPDYVAFQIRRGDKLSLEGQPTPNLDEYMKIVQQKSASKNIFVFCDDYRDYEYLQAKYQDYNFYTLCSVEEQGYMNDDFQKLNDEERQKGFIKLFTNIEILRNSQYCIGTEIANPSFFLRTIMEEENFCFVERKETTYE